MRVLHLVGSPTDEFFARLSRLYARGCLAELGATTGHHHVIAHIWPDGTWGFPASLDDAALAATPRTTLAGALQHVADLAPDVALPQLFCHEGMTTYRALLLAACVPMIGNRPDAMALGAHKPRARAVVTAAGVAVPAGEVVRRGGTVTLPPPVVVKPADADNSTGIALVRHPDELGPALDRAWAEAAEALVERYVPLGREVRCGVLERDGELLVLPLEEYAVDPDRKPIRGAGDKLRSTPAGDLGLVAKDAEHAWIVDADDPVTGAVGDLARRAYRALGCRHYGLFDVRVDPAGTPFFLEAGLYCSFAPDSVLCVMGRAAGLSVADMFDACARAATTP